MTDKISNKKIIFGVFIWITLSILVIVLSEFLFSRFIGDVYTTKLHKVVDGDTVIVDDGISNVDTRIELIGINAPKKDEQGYQVAKNWLKQYKHKTVILKCFEFGFFNRKRECEIISNNRSLNKELLKKGLVKPAKD